MMHKPQHDPTSPSPADANPDTDRVEPRESGDELGAGIPLKVKPHILGGRVVGFEREALPRIEPLSPRHFHKWDRIGGHCVRCGKGFWTNELCPGIEI